MADSTKSDAALNEYITRVRAIPRLDREQEHELAVRALGGDTVAGHRLANANLRFAVAIAIQYRRYSIPLADLIAEGNLGLMLAVRKFDPERGTRFVTYAGYWIRAYILDLVVKSTSMVGGGTGALRSKVFFRLRRERAQLAGVESDSERVVETLAASFGVDTERMSRMLRQLDGRDVSLDGPLHADSSLTMLDALPDTGISAESALAQSELDQERRPRIDAALSELDRRERFILEHRVMGENEVSLAELGRTLGVSRERARQLEARAKRKLRHRLSAFHDAA